MGLLGGFWHKKKDDSDLGVSSDSLDSKEVNLSSLPDRDLQPNFPDFKPGRPLDFDRQDKVTAKDIDLILSKLELINRKLEEIDRRVQFIEKVAKESR